MTIEQFEILLVYVECISRTKTLAERFDIEEEFLQFLQTHDPPRLSMISTEMLVHHGYMTPVQRTTTEYVWTNKKGAKPC